MKPREFLHVGREVAKNLVKGAFPTLVTRLKRQTGRGDAEDTPEAVLAYCRSVFDGYLAVLGASDPEALLAGRCVVELGPGDTLTTGMLFVAHGARRYVAVDRFDLSLDSPRNVAIAELLLASLEPERRHRLERVISGGRIVEPERLGRLRMPAERMTLPEPADLVVSQAVLEHVAELDAVIGRMAVGCAPGALMAHHVDLSDHDLNPGEPFRFLTPSPRLWRAMHCFRGSPNRERLPRYRQLLTRHGFELLREEVVERADLADVRATRPGMHATFAPVSDEDMAVLSFRFAARRRA